MFFNIYYRAQENVLHMPYRQGTGALLRVITLVNGTIHINSIATVESKILLESQDTELLIHADDLCKHLVHEAIKINGGVRIQSLKSLKLGTIVFFDDNLMLRDVQNSEIKILVQPLCSASDLLRAVHKKLDER